MLLLRLRRIYYSYRYYHNAMSTGLRSKDAILDSWEVLENEEQAEHDRGRGFRLMRQAAFLCASREFFSSKYSDALIQELRVALHNKFRYVLHAQLCNKPGCFTRAIYIHNRDNNYRGSFNVT